MIWNDAVGTLLRANENHYFTYGIFNISIIDTLDSNSKAQGNLVSSDHGNWQPEITIVYV